MKKTIAWLFIALFLAVCALPGAAYLAGYEPENYEKRPLAREAELVSRKGLNLAFPRDFDNWWGDHFGLREEMVTAFHALTMAAFRDTLNQKVVVGKGTYLFYAETMDDFLDINLLSGEEIEKAAVCLRLQKEYCESRNMRFVFMIAPNKNTVYPEYMPERFRPTGRAGNRERLYAALEAAGVDTIDLAAVLIAHKPEGDLYFERDTHWNERGALVGYRALMEYLMQGAPYEDFSDLQGREESDYRGDLHNFVLPAAEGRTQSVDFGFNEDRAYSVDEGANPARDISFGTTSAANAYRLLMFRDSFGETLIPILSSGVGRAVYSQEFPYNYVFTAEAFDAVAIELVERNIKNLLAAAPLMPAVEKAPPEGAQRAGAVVMERTRAGYTQLYGCYDGAYAGAVYVRLAFADGTSRSFEAFPVLDGAAADAAARLSSPQGFVVTLPEGLGEWASVDVLIARG